MKIGKPVGLTPEYIQKHRQESDNSNRRYSLKSANKDENLNRERNSSVSMPTSHKGQEVSVTRGTGNKVTFTDSEVNLFKNKLDKISVKLSADNVFNRTVF